MWKIFSEILSPYKCYVAYAREGVRFQQELKYMLVFVQEKRRV